MVNPFDRTFFRLILGFTFILSLSFSIMYFVNKYSSVFDNKQATALKNDSDQIKIKK